MRCSRPSRTNCPHAGAERYAAPPRMPFPKGTGIRGGASTLCARVWAERCTCALMTLLLAVLVVGCRQGEARSSIDSEKSLTRARSGAVANSPRLPRSTGTGNEPRDDEEDESEATLFRRLDESFGRSGDVKDGVYRLVTPRADLMVTMEEMDVPTGAFIESDFRFWRCPCGKALVNGQFVVADYEANDVVDELQEHHLRVVTIAPLLLHERPRLLMIRFQGEGRSRELADALKSALSYTGEARHAPLPVDLSPPAD
jgi:hypothetical protein